MTYISIVMVVYWRFTSNLIVEKKKIEFSASLKILTVFLFLYSFDV